MKTLFSKLPLRSPGIFVFILLLGIIELGMLTFLKKNINGDVSPFLFLFIQLLIGVVPLIAWQQKTSGRPPVPKFTWLVALVVYLAGLLGAVVLMQGVIAHYPNFGSISDVIPQAQVLSERLLKLEYPYQPIPFGDYTMPMPTYLPAHWMPYLLSAFFQFDPRWVCFLLFSVGWLLLVKSMLSLGVGKWEGILLTVLPVFILSAVKDHDVMIWAISLEMMVVGYYLILGAGLVAGRGVVQVSGIVLCLMSRFSLVFWLPVYFWVTFKTKGKSLAFRYAFFIALGCAVLYVPFLIKEPLQFFKSQEYYNNCSGVEWSLGERPPHLYNKIGFARFFFESHRGDLLAGVLAIKKTMLILTSLISVFLIWLFQKIKNRTDPDLFLICSLKLSLAIFYTFIQIPYHYLYVVPMIVTLAVLVKLAEGKVIRATIESNE